MPDHMHMLLSQSSGFAGGYEFSAHAPTPCPAYGIVTYKTFRPDVPGILAVLAWDKATRFANSIIECGATFKKKVEDVTYWSIPINNLYESEHL